MVFCFADAAKHKILLEDISPQQQLSLRFDKVNAFVSTDYEQPGILTQIRRAVDAKKRMAAAEAKKKQVRGTS